MRDIWPGVLFPRGATFDGHGVNLAVYWHVATRIEVCLYDPADPGEVDPGNWSFRMGATVEDLLADEATVKRLAALAVDSGRKTVAPGAAASS
jgi:hypothetical protein